MKKTMFIILAFIAGFASVICLGMFVQWDVNIGRMSQEGRMLCAVIGFPVAFVFALVMEDNFDKKQ